MIGFISALLILILSSPNTQAQVKSVSVKADEIVNIKLGLGIATIVQLPDAIESIVIGDQSGFKVESLDRAITIKPLRVGARSNLYLTTGSRRYILRLLTMPSTSADYVVYVKDQSRPDKTIWRVCERIGHGKTLSLKLNRIGTTRTSGVVVFDLKILSKSSQRFTPDMIWLTQGGKSKVINALFLSQTEVSRTEPGALSLVVMKSDLQSKMPVTIEIRGHDHVALLVPTEFVWQ